LFLALPLFKGCRVAFVPGLRSMAKFFSLLFENHLSMITFLVFYSRTVSRWLLSLSSIRERPRDDSFYSLLSKRCNWRKKTKRPINKIYDSSFLFIL